MPIFLFLSTTLTWKLQLQMSRSSKAILTSLHAPPSLKRTAQTRFPYSEGSPSRSLISIAYITTIAFCADGRAIPERKYSYRDAPAVLAHSIRKANLNSNYTHYALYAIVHPQAYDCSKGYLNDYRIIIQESPVLPNDIATVHYRKLIKTGGCCGAREFLKLYAYNMTNHDAVVHFDSDTIMLQPMDDLLNALFYAKEFDFKDVPLMRPEQFLSPGQKINAFITRDYIQGNPHMPRDADRFAIQGGFFVVKPSRDVLMEMIAIIRRGNYTHQTGWEGSKIGNFYGAAQIQGFLAYYYSVVHPENVVELNRCRYNTMVYDEPKSACPACEDCRTTPLDQIKSVHFTTCQKPWACKLPDFGKPPEMCRHVQHLWFQLRRDLEMKWKQIPQERNPVTSGTDYTLGYCQNGTYRPMSFPQ